jgi:glyoxylate reductase
MKKALVTGDSITSYYLDRLREQGFEVHNPQEHLSEEALIDALQGTQVYLLGGLEHATSRALCSASDLKLIAFLGAGYHSFIDYEAATELGIAITNTPGTMIDSVAELTVGHLLGLRRQIASLNHAAKAGQTIAEKSTELRGQTAGIIGMGAIGTRVAEILVQGLGMRVVYHNRHPRPQIERELEVRYVSLEELLHTSDVVSLHVPLTPETTGMLGERQLALMQPHALIVCTARVETIDGHALYRALSSGRLRGAAFDGYYIEPLPGPEEDEWKLLSLPDTVFLVTPHIASLTDNARDRMAAMALESIVTFVRTGDDVHLVNPAFRDHTQRCEPTLNKSAFG